MTQNARHGVKIESQAASAAKFHTVLRTSEKIYLFLIFKNYFSGLRTRKQKYVFRHRKGYSLIPPVPGRPVKKNGISNVVGWFKFIFGGKDYLRQVKVKALLRQVKLKVKMKMKMKMKKDKMKMKHRRLGQND